MSSYTDHQEDPSAQSCASMSASAYRRSDSSDLVVNKSASSVSTMRFVLPPSQI